LIYIYKDKWNLFYYLDIKEKDYRTRHRLLI
jgi:hypothetical protein